MRIVLLSLAAFFVACVGIATLPPVAVAQTAQSAVHGNQVFQYWCSNCHGAGPGHPGTTALQAKYHGAPPALLEQRTDLTTETVKYYVRHGLSIMPVFRKTEISDIDLNDLAAYLAKTKN